MEKQTIKIRLIKLGILLAFLFCYLEWGKDQSGFIYQLEYTALMKSNKADSFMHPLILLPLLGQVFLIFSICVNRNWIFLTRISILFLSILVLMFLLVGILRVDIKIAGATLPFLFLAGYYLKLTSAVKVKSA